MINFSSPYRSDSMNARRAARERHPGALQEDAIEHAIALLETLDPDPEPDVGGEPSLCGLINEAGGRPVRLPGARVAAPRPMPDSPLPIIRPVAFHLPWAPRNASAAVAPESEHPAAKSASMPAVNSGGVSHEKASSLVSCLFGHERRRSRGGSSAPHGAAGVRARAGLLLDRLLRRRERRLRLGERRRQQLPRLRRRQPDGSGRGRRGG